MNDPGAIYNSRLTKVYVEYINTYYPHININELLEYAGMSKSEVEDPGQWFSQRQVDRLHEILVEKTGDPGIARNAGRFAASTRAMGVLRQYTLGLLGLRTVYLLMEKYNSFMTKGTTLVTKRLAPGKVEVISTPKPGVKEKPYQCENRIGILESVAKVFTDSLGTVDHPSCFHLGDKACRYIISWEKMASLIWKRIRNGILLISIFASVILLFYLPLLLWFVIALLCSLFILLFWVYSEHVKVNELTEAVRAQGDAAEDQVDEINIRYNNARLVQEIGQATSRILDVKQLINTVARILEKRLDFDRGMIMLANEAKTRLVYISGYGYKEEDLLKGTEFNLEKRESKGVFVLAFRDRKPYLISDISEFENQFSKRSIELARKMGVKSLICAPIVYEKESLGILAVDNLESKRALTQSDMSLLMGVASQMAVSMTNALSFQKLQESEEKYRTILESIEEGYFEVNVKGDLTFFNDALMKISAFDRQELMGMNYRDYTTDETAKDMYKIFNQVYKTGKPAEYRNYEIIRKDGKKRVLEMSVSVMMDQTGSPIGFRGVHRDVTEKIKAKDDKKRLEYQLQRAQKMEAIGTLAGGVAHDLNNILAGFVTYPELLLLELPKESPLRKPILTIKKSGDKAAAIVQDLLTLARRGVSVREVLHLNKAIAEYLDSPEHQKLLFYHPNIRIRTDLYDDLLPMVGSPVHLSKAVMNLISNAAEAMPSGGTIRLKTENQYLDAPFAGFDAVGEGDYVVLTVSDTGIGISPTDLDRIFEPFYTKKVMGRSGTGLGMAVVWGTVKDHKGSIDVQSTEGKGTTFRLFFPAARGDLVEEKKRPTVIQYEGQGEVILIVDDVEEQREIATRLLKKLGYAVYSVSSGEQAVHYMKNHSADLLVLDMIMDPGIDGLETYKKILELHPGQKAIIASGYSETERVKEAQRLGAGSYVRKPYLLDRIGAAVRKELDR